MPGTRSTHDRQQLEHLIRAAATIADDNEIVISKYVAEREKDVAFLRVAIAHGLVDEATLRFRLESTPIDKESRERIRTFIARDFASS